MLTFEANKRPALAIKHWCKCYVPDILYWLQMKLTAVACVLYLQLLSPSVLLNRNACFFIVFILCCSFALGILQYLLQLLGRLQKMLRYFKDRGINVYITLIGTHKLIMVTGCCRNPNLWLLLMTLVSHLQLSSDMGILRRKYQLLQYTLNPAISCTSR